MDQKHPFVAGPGCRRAAGCSTGWHLNEQLQYWPLYAAGRFDLGRTLESLFSRNIKSKLEHLKKYKDVHRQSIDIGLGWVVVR